MHDNASCVTMLYALDGFAHPILAISFLGCYDILTAIPWSPNAPAQEEPQVALSLRLCVRIQVDDEGPASPHGTQPSASVPQLQARQGSLCVSIAGCTRLCVWQSVVYGPEQADKQEYGHHPERRKQGACSFSQALTWCRQLHEAGLMELQTLSAACSLTTLEE